MTQRVFINGVIQYIALKLSFIGNKNQRAASNGSSCNPLIGRDLNPVILMVYRLKSVFDTDLCLVVNGDYRSILVPLM